jgi:ParB-like chromosome segregation protein Spo0J
MTGAEEAEFSRRRLTAAAGSTQAAVRGMARDARNRAEILEAFAQDAGQPEEARADATAAAARLREAPRLLQEAGPLLESVKTAGRGIFQATPRGDGKENPAPPETTL